MRLCVVGAGYVGLTTAVCLAHLGHHVDCLDKDAGKVELLAQGKVHFYEPYVADLLFNALSQGRLQVTSNPKEGLSCAEVIFLALPTPSIADGCFDLKELESAFEQICQYGESAKLVVSRSTALPGTARRLMQIMSQRSSAAPAKLDVVTNPEFLREGTAVRDFFAPNRIILGVNGTQNGKLLIDLYKPISDRSVPPFEARAENEVLSSDKQAGPIPILVTDMDTAEMIKCASNAFLATKVSFINEIAAMCRALGIDSAEVARGMGLDPRISPHYLEAGLGFGGSCLPKDTRALAALSRSLNLEPRVLDAVLEVNEQQPLRMVELARQKLGDLRQRKVGILGLAFKPGTDDLREASSIAVINRLLNEGAQIMVYDPKAMANARTVFGDSVTYGSSAREVAEKTECLLLVTEWDEFKDPELYRGRSVIMGRRVLPPDALKGVDCVWFC